MCNSLCVNWFKWPALDPSLFLSALMLVVDRQEGHLAGFRKTKRFLKTNPGVSGVLMGLSCIFLDEHC